MFEQLFNGAARLRESLSLRAVGAVAAGAVLLAACETTGTGPEIRPITGPSTPTDAAVERPARDAVVDQLVTPPHRAADAERLVRAALLLPFSSRNAGARNQARSMLNAAQLALFQSRNDNFVLIPKDTGGTAEGARSAAHQALREGADVILGPLFADSVRAAAEEARAYNKPVIAYSTDRDVAETGAYLLSRTPEEEVARIVEYAGFQGLVTFAVFAPDNDYGLRVQEAVESAARDVTGFLVTWEYFPSDGDAAMIDLPARRLARYDSRLAARNSDAEDEFELPYDAVMLPAGGVQLLSAAPLLPYYDVDPRIVRFLGTSLWLDDDVAREPSLAHGWFPGPDQDSHDAFRAAYADTFGEAPSRLASLAFDSVWMTASLTRGVGAAGLRPEAIERPSGFRGADGLFRFNADRLSQHALAIYEVRNGAFVVIDPAPDAFDATVF